MKSLIRTRKHNDIQAICDMEKQWAQDEITYGYVPDNAIFQITKSPNHQITKSPHPHFLYPPTANCLPLSASPNLPLRQHRQ